MGLLYKRPTKFLKSNCRHGIFMEINIFAQYTGLMLATFACLLAGGICTFVYKEHFVERVEANMIELMDRYPAPNAGGDNFAKDTWDRLQSEVS